MQHNFHFDELNTIMQNNQPNSETRTAHAPTYKDAMTGRPLDHDLVMAGREVEMAFIHEWRVYDYADFDECYQRTGSAPISTK